MKEVSPNIYVSTDYPDITVGFIATSAGAIAVDAPALPKHARDWRERIVAAVEGPILYTVLTDAQPRRLVSAGLLRAPIVATRAAYGRAIEYTESYWRGFVRALARRYPGEAEDLADSRLMLPEILFSGRLTVHKGDADVTVKPVAGGAPGSAWVDLPDRGVLFTGDTLVLGSHPFLDAAPDTEAWLDTLTRLRRPRFSEITMIPGCGPPCDQSATESLSEYIRVVRRRVHSLKRAGRQRADVAEFVPELLSLFSVREEDRDRIERRAMAGAGRVYDELQPSGVDSG